MSCGPGCCLPAGVGSGADMCPMAPEATSQLGWALVPPRVLQPRTLPPCYGGLRRHHVSYGPGSCLPTGVGFGVTTCPVALDPASLLGWAPALPHILRPWNLLPCWGGLWCHHVSCNPGPCLPTRVGSDVATCHAAPDPASLLGCAPVPPHVHSHYGLWASRVKEIVVGPIVHLRLTHSPGARERGFPRCRHA
jgi:hypothetical protein